MVAMIIISTAIAAVMNFMASSTTAHGKTGQLSIAMVLANNLHEYALSLDPGLPPTGTPTSITCVLQLDGRTFSPPLDARGVAIGDMTGWSQKVAVVSVQRGDLTAATPVAATASNLRRLQVVIFYNNRTVYVANWLIAPSIPQT